MSIYKEGKTWRADVYINSKRIKVKKGFTNKKEAKQWHDRQIISFQEIENQNDAHQKKWLFDELITKFEEIHLKTISQSTTLRYKIDLKYRIIPFFKGATLKNITPLMIESFKVKTLLELSPKSTANCIGLLKTIFIKAVKWGMLDRNPSEHIEMKKNRQTDYQWWQHKEDISKFLSHAKNDRYYLAYRLALECGMRLGEIIGLSKSDINLENCDIHIKQQWLEKQHCYGPPKHGKNRHIRFSKDSDLHLLLKNTIETNPKEDIIFLGSKGGRLSGRKLSGVYFQKLIEKSGVPRIRFHDLRHTFASWFMIKTDNIWDLKGILGHADIHTTQIYAHLSSKGVRAPNFDWTQ